MNRSDIGVAEVSFRPSVPRLKIAICKGMRSRRGGLDDELKVRQYNKSGKNGWEVDIVLRMPDGEVLRERLKSPVSSKSGAKYWGEQREMHLLRKGRPKRTPAPTVEEFAPREQCTHRYQQAPESCTEVERYRTASGPD